MYEQEKNRATHILLLLVYTFLTIALTAESFLLGWEMGAVVLLILALVACWVLHITELIPENIRLWLYYIITMLTFFFYGIHETSIFDLAPVMLVGILLYSSTEQYYFIKLSVVTYFVTMIYDFVFVLEDFFAFSALEISRILLHFFVVYMAGQMVKVQMIRNSKEKRSINERIESLEENNRRTEDFLTNVSHELRTPINAVTGITTTMLKNEDDVNKRKDIHAIQIAGQRLFRQIGDILDYTEIDTGRVKVSEESYMISSLINDIIVGNRLAERDKNLELVFDVDATIPAILLGDEKKLKKILIHLIDNAFKFTQKGGIYVRLYALKKPYGINLCMKVTDTGIGIAKEELEKIKERFYQSNGGRNRKAGGLGLGLPIVYGMVSAMEGFIQIDSTVGKGTTVTVSIPQKIVDSSHSMSLNNKDALCLGCYLCPEKYEVPEVRDFYNDLIDHMVLELDIPLHRVSGLDELKKLLSVYRLTHIFIGKEEYQQNTSFFENLDSQINIIVVASNDFGPISGSRIKLLKKPFFCLPIVNILNAGSSEGVVLKEKNLICPGIRVLVVDDEPMNLMVSEGIFKGYQMIVKTAESGRKAIEICEKEDFDLIFLDHMMPEMDGVETIKRLRKLSSDTGRLFTIVAFTANAVSGAREMFLQEGFDEFISKPIEILELERILRKLLPKSAISYVYADEKAQMSIDEQSLREDDTRGLIQGQSLREDDTQEPLQEQAQQNAFGQKISVQTNAGSDRDDKMARLEDVGINTKSGLRYYAGDRVFYEELLIKFAKDAEQKQKDINQYFEKEDFKNYCILVHALKSTSKMIGADALSEKAKNLEMAAKNEDAAFIRENHAEQMQTYQQVVQCICDVYELEKKDGGKDSEEKIEISKEEFLEQLFGLKENLDNYEMEQIENIISQIKGYSYQEDSVEAIIAPIAKDVEDFEFVKASDKTEALIQKVEGGDAE